MVALTRQVRTPEKWAVCLFCTGALCRSLAIVLLCFRRAVPSRVDIAAASIGALGLRELFLGSVTMFRRDWDTDKNRSLPRACLDIHANYGEKKKRGGFPFSFFLCWCYSPGLYDGSAKELRRTLYYCSPFVGVC